MVSRKQLLGILPQTPDRYEKLADEQTVEDIMEGVEISHLDYADQYDMIFEYFIGRSPEQTCRNIWNFERNNFVYKEEKASKQTVRSVSNILAMCKTERIDCKNYALFAGGILDAINRSGEQKIPFVYRYASDDLAAFLNPFEDIEAGHVFVVAFPGSDNEIWIDAIPQIRFFDEHPQYYYELDKKVSAMALYKVSGARRNRVGSLTDIAKGATGVASAVIPYAGVANALISLFSSGGPNPNDWKGWTSGDAKHWVLNDGDSVKNEALNIASWINNQGTTQGVTAMIFSDDNGVPRVTLSQIADKLRRGGYPTQAMQIENYFEGDNVTAPAVPGTGTGTGIQQPNQGVYNPATGRYDLAPTNKTPSWVAPVAIGTGVIVVTKLMKLW